MSSGRLCGFTPNPITFCRKISRLQVARGLALKRLIKGKHDFRRTATSKNNVEKRKNKEIKRTVSEISSVVEASPKSLNSIKHVSTPRAAASPISVKNGNKKVNTPRKNNLDDSSPKCMANFILMVELRKNIFAFRDMIDLPSLDGSLSVTEIITQTMKDLQKLSPEIVTINQSFEMEGADMDKMLIFFYEDLRAIGDSWIMDSDWIYRSKYKNSGVGKNKSDRLVEHVLAALDGLIKTTRERFGMMDLESEGRKSFTPKGVTSEARRSFTRSASYSESNNSFYPSPLTPRSVLPGTMLMSSNSTSPSLWNLRAQALDRLSPVDLKRFTMQILSQRDSESVNDMKIGIEEENEDTDKLAEEEEEEEEGDNDFSVLETEKHDIKTEDHREGSETEHDTEAEHKIKGSEGDNDIEAENHSDGSETEHEIETEHHHHEGFETEDHSETTTSETNSIDSSQREDFVTKSPPPPPLPSPQSPSPTALMLNNKSTLLSQPPPPPPSPQSELKAPAPPPPPPMSKASESGDFCQYPKPKSMNGYNAPSMPAPPAPPGSVRSLRAKKATSKLKRSAQIANLYWVLKGKLEGRGVEGKPTKASKGQNNVAEKSPVKGARSGMADALAEMTKRSSYFQQIEEDVQKYAKAIEELKSSIQSFQTKDMKELLEFHSKVESILEKLTDETQVLARFEGFPEKKLEVIRTAGALYKKLDGILVELKNWKIEPPINDLLDKIERYFNKFKGEIETVERTKDEDAKMFQRHNINIDFEVLVQVKETMVDVSSNCMELALKERREANEEAKNSEESKMNNMKAERAKRLWRAFQFAFKVYTFAGGHDERADCLTRQLAHEIQTDPDQTNSSIMS
ncbi:hypothetical protein CARUB_v10000203mg [Capsella rubella]|uniref:Hydroxyproline-rich glycoprotein family protein n=1 Tax=Capsella rubella TaxID=81985 RepID=R0FCX3_9BRAS|nr:uncharacterized protein At4g04980 [Capsella rubella]EOA19952.1 hypothetical protein CARUB_v10000203mg [Capsella rubella]